MRGQEHPPELKAAAMAALLAGQGVNAVAREYKLSRSVVSGWKAHLSSPEFEQVRTQKGERLEALLFAGLESNLEAQRAITSAVKDESYIKKQPASEIAVLYGVLADKAIRLLEAHCSSTGAEE